MMGSNTVSRRNYNAVDAAKFIMAVFVIAIHTNPLADCTNSVIFSIYELFVRMAVPFFFLCSGYFLALKFTDFNQTHTNISVVVNYLKKIVRMYLVWSIAYAPLAIYNYWSTDTSILKAILSYIRGFVFIGEHYNSWHLWYLLSTIYALLFVIVLFRFNLNTKSWYLIICGICFLSIGIDELVKYDGSLVVIRLLKILVSYTIANGRILQGAFLIPIGMLLAHKEISISKCIITFILGFLCNYLISHSVVSSMLLILCSIALFGIVLQIDLKNNFVYPVLRKLSTNMYFVHMYVWTFYYAMVYKETTFGVDCFIATTAASLVVAAIPIIINDKKQIGGKLHKQQT